jgi:predicted  nucleic acid-binding Zn-ribbon protein
MYKNIQLIGDCLRNAAEKYKTIATNANLNHSEWKINVELLKPIVDGLSGRAASYVEKCENAIKDNELKQDEAHKKLSFLYKDFDNCKKNLSDLEVEQVELHTNVILCSAEINKLNLEILDLQKKIAKQIQEKDYWNTVFWSTFWIPFANIGTGIKLHQEDGKLIAMVNVKCKEIKNNRKRIDESNMRLQQINEKLFLNNVSSSALVKNITAINGEINSATNIIGELRREIGLWHAILTACDEIRLQLKYSNGKTDIVKNCFQSLFDVEKILSLPTTDKYVKGRICKGSILSVGGRLNPDEFLMSENRRFVAIMQPDNNFVVYNSEKPLWASNTCNAQGKGCIVLDSDGLVSLSSTNPGWNTKRRGAVKLVMQNDGNLVTYDMYNKSLWSSDTYTYANVPSICFNAEITNPVAVK